MSKVDEDREGNDDPQEVVGHVGSECSPAGASVGRDEIMNDDNPVHYSVSSFTDEQFEPQPVPIGINPADGMPQPIDQFNVLPIAPPFSRRALVCMEDDTEFVELFTVEVPASSPVLNSRSMYDDCGVERERRTFPPSEVQKRYGLRVVEFADGSVIPVRPKRPVCEHYRRSVFCADPSIPEGEFGHSEMQRSCMARRSVGGAFMSLSGEAVYACELRSPRDPASEQKHIVDKDNERLNHKVENVPLFNL